MLAVLAGTTGVFGLAIGSFLNVVIYRVPAGRSVVRPSSTCPGCDTAIRGVDNVPILSWLVLGRRCRTCRMRISARYPAIEAVTALAFVVVALASLPAILGARDAVHVGAATLDLVALLYLAAISIALAMIDVDVQRLPNAIVGPSYLVILPLLVSAALLIGDPPRLVLAAIGGAASIVFYGLLAFVYPGGMGLGDVKLSGLLGAVMAYFGLQQLVVGTLAAFLLGGVVGVTILIVRRTGRRTGIPFGPWMLAGTWIGIAAGAPIAHAYLSLFGIA